MRSCVDSKVEGAGKKSEKLVKIDEKMAGVEDTLFNYKLGK